MPAATTTMSQSSVVPSLKASPVTSRSPSTALVSLSRWTFTPIASMVDFRIAPPVGSSWVSIRCPTRCTTWTSQPWLRRPRAASRPSNPPPITTARRLCFALRTIAWQSSMVRKPNSPGLILPSGRFTPAIGGMKARLPVAMRSLSKRSLTAVLGHHDLGRPVDLAHPRAGVQLDVVLLVPFERIENISLVSWAPLRMLESRMRL